MGGFNKSLTDSFEPVKKNVSSMASRISEEFQNGLNKLKDINISEITEGLQSSFDVTHYASFGGLNDSARKLEDDRFVALKDAVLAIRDFANRDVVVTVNGKELARTAGDNFTEYQKQKEIMNNRMKGLI